MSSSPVCLVCLRICLSVCVDVRQSACGGALNNRMNVGPSRALQRWVALTPELPGICKTSNTSLDNQLLG